MRRTVIDGELSAAMRDHVTSSWAGAAPLTSAAALVARIAVLPPDAAFEVEQALRSITAPWDDAAAGAYGGRATRLPEVTPERAPLLIFNENGFVREAALRLIDRLPPTAFFVAALAWRLNDWVAQVREAAATCAARALPAAPPDAIARAAPFLLEHVLEWRRWTEPPPVLIDALRRPECRAHLTHALQSATHVRGSVMRGALRLGLLDDELSALSRAALRPEVRAMALKVLIDGEHAWVTHYARQWVDRRYGTERAVPILARRPVARPLPVARLIRQGAEDRNAIVRRAAVIGLVRFCDELGRDEIDELMARLGRDKSRAVTSRLAYLRRRIGLGGSSA